VKYGESLLIGRLVESTSDIVYLGPFPSGKLSYLPQLYLFL
jgi:hypothetical protein